MNAVISLIKGEKQVFKEGVFMFKIIKKKRNISYFMKLEFSRDEEELLEELAQSYRMTLSEYVRFLVFKRLQNAKKSKDRGLRIIS